MNSFSIDISTGHAILVGIISVLHGLSIKLDKQLDF